MKPWQIFKLSRIPLWIGTALTCMHLSAPVAPAATGFMILQPKGWLGHIEGAGHVAVVFPGICMESPVKMRPCKEGEDGIVVNRYPGATKEGYDWIIIPRSKYLYGTEKIEDAPVISNKMIIRPDHPG